SSLTGLTPGTTYHFRAAATNGGGLALGSDQSFTTVLPGDLDTTFNPNVTGSYVLATTVQPDAKILIGGRFTSVSGQPCNNIARLNADGTVETTNTFNPGTGAN